MVVQTDFTDEEQVSRLFRRTMEQFGRLDVVVRVSSQVAPLDQLSVETWDRVVVAMNLKGPLSAREATDYEGAG